MKRILKTVFGLTLVLAMMFPVSLVALADTITIGGTVGFVNVCHITYDANGGNGGYEAPSVTLGSTDTVCTLSETGITRRWHTFTGWNTAADGSGMTYLPGSAITLTGDVTLYAQWRRTNKPLVNPVSEDDTAVTGTANPGDTITVTWPDGSISTTATGFDGAWSVAVPSTVTLKQGETISVTVTDADGSVSEPVVITVTGGTIVTPPDPGGDSGTTGAGGTGASAAKTGDTGIFHWFVLLAGCVIVAASLLWRASIEKRRR